jgi:dihydrofolate reductase
MRKLIVFNQISLDGYFVDPRGDMSWAHNARIDPEFNAFVEGNAKGGGELVFGRITYDLMVSYWPTPTAAKNDPVVAERMNSLPKVVFSRSLAKAAWNNTRIVKGDLAAEVGKLKAEQGPGMVIMGSGTIVSKLAQADMIDEYQFVVIPIVLGGGRSLFEGSKRLDLTLRESRSFANGNVFLSYAPVV